MGLSIKLRVLQTFAGIFIIALLYGGLYDMFPALRDQHNRMMFRLTHQAVEVQATVIHVGADSHRKRVGYSFTPVFGITYQFNGATHLGFVRAYRSGSASDHGVLSNSVKGKTFDILVDARNPSKFYGQPYHASWPSVFPNLVWYVIEWAEILVAVHFIGYWIWYKRTPEQSLYRRMLKWSDLKLAHWPAMMGLWFGMLFWLYVVLLRPWYLGSLAYSAVSLPASQSLLGADWQGWRDIEYRLKSYAGGGNRCADVGYVDAIHMEWEIRWRNESRTQALAQVDTIGKARYCEALLAGNQTISLSQTSNNFDRINDGRNRIDARVDGYEYADVSVTMVYRRNDLVKNQAISIALDDEHVTRFPLFLYTW